MASKVTTMKRRGPSARSKLSVREIVSDPTFRALVSAVASRSQLANVAGYQYNGRRDMYQALGYPRILFPLDYRARFNRDAVAARIVEAKPQSTWRGGGEVIEDQDPNSETEFEKQWGELDERLTIWSMFQRADILAGLGRYAVLLIGAPGDLDKPLAAVGNQKEIYYLTPYSELDAQIQVFDINEKSPRFGQPEFYGIARMTASTVITPAPEIGISVSTTSYGGKRVHHSRVIHLADGLLDDHIYGLPRLERCWNLLDDLMKVTGGGAEAYWRRADAGLQVDVDPEMDLSPEDEAQLDDEIDEYIHKLRRVVRTRGVKMQPLTSLVSGIKDPIDGIMSQLSAGTGIPQRILMGSERGQLASTQDDDNWTERITDRRRDYAKPVVARPFINRMISINALPKPEQYEVAWPELNNLDEVQRSKVAEIWAGINKDMGQEVVTANEIRDRLLGLPSRDDLEGPAPSVEAVKEGFEAAKNKRLFLRKYMCLSMEARSRYFPNRPTTSIGVPQSIRNLEEAVERLKLQPHKEEIVALSTEITALKDQQTEFPKTLERIMVTLTALLEKDPVINVTVPPPAIPPSNESPKRRFVVQRSETGTLIGIKEE